MMCRIASSAARKTTGARIATHLRRRNSGVPLMLNHVCRDTPFIAATLLPRFYQGFSAGRVDPKGEERGRRVEPRSVRAVLIPDPFPNFGRGGLRAEDKRDARAPEVVDRRGVRC